ncbi:hypothetical protein [Granulicella sibirica]|uniref:Uncharacterized protein n=1 Tax=Granulicella sibirica TaxID=2479048 RepID=A0A4Q0T2Q9_9BACT|nr:hypothetical protein [Granulicella sibirica]RXH57132.1 hypothetical protein GRAN_0442 [Granulicella sibirica]
MEAKTPATSPPDRPPPLNIIEAERFYRGLLITFESGEIAFYSADLLYRNLPNATAFDPTKSFSRPT